MFFSDLWDSLFMQLPPLWCAESSQRTQTFLLFPWLTRLLLSIIFHFLMPWFGNWFQDKHLVNMKLTLYISLISRVVFLDWNIWGFSLWNWLYSWNTELKRKENRKVTFLRKRGWEALKHDVPMAWAGLGGWSGLRSKQRHKIKQGTERRKERWSKSCFLHFDLESTLPGSF